MKFELNQNFWLTILNQTAKTLFIKLKNAQEKVVEVETGEGGWVDTCYLEGGSKEEQAANNQAQEIVDDKKGSKPEELKRISELNAEKKASDENEGAEDMEEDDDDDEAVDMDEYEHNVRDDDDSTVIIRKPTQQAQLQAAAAEKPSTSKEDENDEDVFIPTRTYDLNITYDNYYRTPRLWLSGYDENNKPLTIEQMYEDISEEHAKKTVTFEAHPHIPGTLMASIHPCRHAEVMKKLINLVAESGKEMEVYSYLMVFLKFVQSVIPTIEYDYTRNITI